MQRWGQKQAGCYLIGRKKGFNRRRKRDGEQAGIL